MTDRLIRIRFIGDGITTVAGQVTALGKSVSATASKMTSADKDAAKFRRGLDATGQTAGKVGLIAAAGLGAIVVATANFDQAMSNVRAATHETASNMEELRAAAIKTGADTVFSASEAAGAIENLAKAGVSTKDILNGGLNGALSLAAAGGLEVADAAEIAATALTQFHLAGKDVPHVADLLAAGAGKAQGEVSDLSYALKQSGLVAAQMGISIEETTGTLAAFASAGLLGSDAGTSFRTMLLRLANPAGQAAKLMNHLGISAYDAQGNFIGIRDLAGQLQTAFQGQRQATRDAALATIFGSDAIRAANVLYDQGAQGITDWTTKVNDSGYAAETASIKMDNLKGDLEQFKGSLETALIGAGDGSQGALRNLVQGLTDAVNGFNKLPGPAKSAATSLLAITAITGGGLWFGAKVIGGIARAKVALGELGVQAGTTRTALAGIGKGLAVFAAIEGVNLLSESLGTSEAAVRRWQETLLARSGPDLKSQLATVTEEIKKQQAIVDDAFGPTFHAFGATITPLSFGTDWRDADSKLQALKETQADLKHQMELGTIATEKQTEAVRVNGTTAVMTAQEIADMNEAITKQRDAATETAQAFFGLGQKVDDAKVSLNDWISDMEAEAKALEDFTKNAKRAAKNGLKEGLIAELEKAGPAGALRLQQLADASDVEIARANRAWKRGQRAINEYVDLVGGVPLTVATELQLRGDKEAMAALQAIIDRAKQVPRTIRSDYIINQMTIHNKPKVPSMERASGGYIAGPGTRTSDSIPSWLSNGEYVIKADAVSHYGRAMFDSLNAMRYASGGLVNAGTPATGFDMDRLASAISGDRLLGTRQMRDAMLWAMRTALGDMPVVRASPDLAFMAGMT